jgi:hypothetical protein
VALDACEVLIDIRVLVFQRAVDAAAEALSKRVVVDEEAVFGGVMERLVFGMEGDCGNDEMDMGVMLDLASPGVQNAGEAEAGSLVFGGADVLEGGRTLAQDERVEDFGLRIFQTSQSRPRWSR